MTRSRDAIDRFLSTAAANPSHLAIAVHGTTQTYAEFEARVRRYAAEYSRHRCSSVMVALSQGIDAYAAILGAGLAGCYYAPLNIDVPAEKLLRIVNIMRPDILVGAPAMTASLTPAAPQAVRLDPAALPEASYEGHGIRHDTAYIIFTSGSTGVPKGVVIPRTALDHFVDWVDDSGYIKPTDRVAQFSNIAFDVSVTDIYGALCLGATLLPVVGRSDRTFPARMVARERVTIWNSVPSVLSLMMQAGEITQPLLGSLRLVNTCGEALLPAHVTALFTALPDTIVQNSYGPTETTVTMTELRLDRNDYAKVCGTSIAIGQPINNMTVDLIGGPNPDEGEIVITGPQLASGYWDDPQKTAQSFRTLDINGVATRAYWSGDWAIRRDGHVFFKERIDRQVKFHGYRLELDEVARAIHDSGFPTTCVLKWQEELVAVIERPASGLFVEAELRAALARKLEMHAIPSTMRLIDQLPRNQNDKIDRQAVIEWLDGLAAH